MLVQHLFQCNRRVGVIYLQLNNYTNKIITKRYMNLNTNKIFVDYLIQYL